MQSIELVLGVPAFLNPHLPQVRTGSSRACCAVDKTKGQHNRSITCFRLYSSVLPLSSGVLLKCVWKAGKAEVLAEAAILCRQGSVI